MDLRDMHFKLELTLKIYMSRSCFESNKINNIFDTRYKYMRTRSELY